MKKSVLLVIVFFACFGQLLKAQCNNKLVEAAAAKSGINAIFIRDFKVKLEEGNMENPSPVGRFPIYLKKNIHYRFTVENASEYPGMVILQLLHKSNLMGSTYDFENNIDIQQFDFVCQKNATYLVAMSFKEGKSGCAAGVMSVVINDTVPNIPTSMVKIIDSSNVLYLGIENELDIASTEIQDGKLVVSISEGTISEKSGKYVAQVTKEGVVTIKVKVFDQKNEFIEEDSVIFIAKHFPLPLVALGGLTSGYISREELTRIHTLDLLNPVTHEPLKFGDYEIIEFKISDSRYSTNYFASNSNRITIQQQTFLQSLPEGTRFYILDIHVRTPDGSVLRFEPLQFNIDQ